MAAFKDHFSQIAGAYAQWRPTYPEALFDALSAAVPATASVWEPGCGSGQATRGLAARFATIFATDPSAAQIERQWATEARADNVRLAVEPAESTSLADASVDLIAVAQALHWFDRERFFAECERVLRPGGVLAAWTYQDVVFDDDLREAGEAFRDDIDPYWPAERADVDMGYGDFVWPFEALPTPRLWLRAQWSLAQLLGYLGSLSATSQFRNSTGVDPVSAHADAFAAGWGAPERVRTLRWPLVLHLRRNP